MNLTIRALGHGNNTQVLLDGKPLERVLSVSVRMATGSPNVATIEIAPDRIDIEGDFNVEQSGEVSE